MTTTQIRVDHKVPVFNTYRSERVRSMFNATNDQATRFKLEMDLNLDLDEGDWSIGVIVGPSGTGKSSIGKTLWDGAAWYEPNGWPSDKPIVEAIHPGGDFDEVCAALAAAGLGDVPVWLRPYDVLSTGQKFRADLAKVLAEQPDRVVFDEFTSVVDRQIAKIGAGAFAKSWRRTGKKAILITCHYDVLDWLEPDWVLDTAEMSFKTKEYLHLSRPRIDVEVRLGGWDLWPLFKPHHYLDIPIMVGAKCYVAFVDGEPVAHLAVGTKNLPAKDKDGKKIQTVEARASRLVVMPEWQGAGIGTRFLDLVAQLQLDGEGVLPGRRMTTQFQTSHPQLCAALRRSKKWRQVSGSLYGGHKGKSLATLKRTSKAGIGSGFGGHFRAVQGFRYYGAGVANG
jgi:ABC-type ATPase with predicted acetyltransferase domain